MEHVSLIRDNMTAIVELREKPQLFQWNCLKVTIEHDKNITHHQRQPTFLKQAYSYLKIDENWVANGTHLGAWNSLAT